jgi:hypothetical protein
LKPDGREGRGVLRRYFGEIVYARLCTTDGNDKDRTVLILSSDDECGAGDDLLVLCISSSLQDPQPWYHVTVHDSHERHPVSGLDRPCVAKCNIPDEIAPSSVRRHVGVLPREVMDLIVETYDKIQADENFDDWQ